MAGGDALYLPCGWWHAVVGSKAGAHYGLECNIMSHWQYQLCLWWIYDEYQSPKFGWVSWVLRMVTLVSLHRARGSQWNEPDFFRLETHQARIVASKCVVSGAQTLPIGLFHSWVFIRKQGEAKVFTSQNFQISNGTICEAIRRRFFKYQDWSIVIHHAEYSDPYDPWKWSKNIEMHSESFYDVFRDLDISW